MALFTVGEARAELDRLLPVLDEVVALRAEAAELAAAQAPSAGRRPGSAGCPSSRPPRPGSTS